MNPFVRAADFGDAPIGWVRVDVPGLRPAWVDRDLALEVRRLISDGRLIEAKTLMLWFGGREKTDA